MHTRMQGLLKYRSSELLLGEHVSGGESSQHIQPAAEPLPTTAPRRFTPDSVGADPDSPFAPSSAASEVQSEQSIPGPLAARTGSHVRLLHLQWDASARLQTLRRWAACMSPSSTAQPRVQVPNNCVWV